jgi:hypothetical protein
VAGFCENGNKALYSVKVWEILEHLSDCWLLKTDSAPWGYLVSQLIRSCKIWRTSLQNLGPLFTLIQFIFLHHSDYVEHQTRDLQ